jgi:hypothetical protein
MGRTTLAVDDKIAKKLLAITRTKNVSEFSLVNRMIETFISITDTGAELDSLITSLQLADFVKSMNSFPLPEDTVQAMVDRLYEVDRDWLKKIWAELGKKLGAYARTKLKDLSELEGKAADFIKLVPIRYVKVESSDNSNVNISITVLGGWKEPFSFCMGNVIDGFLEAFGYDTKEIRTGAGFVIISAKQKALNK